MGNQSHSKAFTLIEILVVLIILSIVATFAVLNIGRAIANNQLKNAAEALAFVMPLADQQAFLQATPTGLACSQHSYQVLQFKQNHWQKLPQSLFVAQHLPAAITLQLSVQDQMIAVPEKLPTTPQIIFSGTGNMPKFAVLLRSSNTTVRYQLTSKTDGHIALENF
jgi:general secretion pathway protein H